jgi:hypothetical protein
MRGIPVFGATIGFGLSAVAQGAAAQSAADPRPVLERFESAALADRTIDMFDASLLRPAGNPPLEVGFEPIKGVLPPSTVPEPASWAMMLAGFAIVGGAARRARRARGR